MSKEAKTSRHAAQKFPRRDLTIALGITNCCFAILIAFGPLGDVTAQETPPPAVTPSATPSADISSTPSASPSAPSSVVPPTTPSASASPSPVARSVRISFVPPPLEGTISLGIYAKNEQLVRVLHQEAELDEFEVGPDALNGRWDGKDDDGYDLPTGRYHARGFVVAPTKVEEVKWDNPGQTEISKNVRVKLVANPLENKERPIVELAVGFDDENAFLKTADGLPLITVWPGNDTTRAWITQRADKSLDVFLDYGVSTRQLHVMGISKMMAFDCGDLDLK